MKKKIGVIIPDLAAGDYFVRVLNDQGVEATSLPAMIAPRVEKDAENQTVITTNTEKVKEDLVVALREALAKGHRLLTISCNTLSLSLFTQPALRVLEKDGVIEGSDFRLLTTLTCLKDYFLGRGRKMPLFLGTEPLSRVLPEEEFPTLHNTNRIDLSRLAQEVIWRVKGVAGSDTSTAPNYNNELSDYGEYERKVAMLANELERANLDEVVLGCTELPIAFETMRELGVGQMLKTYDPARIVGKVVNSRKIGFEVGS